MNTLPILLQAEDGSLQRFELFDGKPLEELEKEGVFPDQKYSLLFPDREVSPFERVRIFFNGQDVKIFEEDGHYYFQRGQERVFQDLFGVVQIRIEFQPYHGETSVFTSRLIPILIEESQYEPDILRMKEHVESFYDFLYNPTDHLAPFEKSLKKSPVSHMETRLQLAAGILELYEESFDAFRSKGQFIMKHSPAVDSLERARQIDSRSIRFAATHPEYLVPVGHNQAIALGRQRVLPVKIQFRSQKISYDLYENRVLVDFLVRIRTELQEYLKEMLESEGIEVPKHTLSGFLSSVYYLVEKSQSRQKETFAIITSLLNRLEPIQSKYEALFSLRARDLRSIPEQTYIFQRDLLYNRFFSRIIAWFNEGKSEITKEKVNFTFTKISTLYEAFVLTKLVESLQKDGYQLKESFHYRYNQAQDPYFNSESIRNTFLFKKGEISLTLYYQPVLYDRLEGFNNHLGLYRNNVAYGTPPSRIRYYTPDYILKLTYRKKNYYILMDAKYSSLGSLVARDEMRNLIFKYLTSLTPFDSQDVILGLCLSYGKSDITEKPFSFYNRSIQKDLIPFIEYLPLSIRQRTVSIHRILNKAIQYIQTH